MLAKKQACLSKETRRSACWQLVQDQDSTRKALMPDPVGWGRPQLQGPTEVDPNLAASKGMATQEGGYLA